MRIDVVTIFPEYLAPLELSLLGRARATGPLEIAVHDLRELDPRRAPHRRRHPVRRRAGHGDAARAVGRGAGRRSRHAAARQIVVPTPAGTPVHPGRCAARAGRRAEHLVFACGRYEGIDQRVLDHAPTRMPRARGLARRLRALRRRGRRTGDGGGGRPAAARGARQRRSRWSTSRTPTGCWRRPVYTKPAEWRGHEVPEVLRSGDHGRIARWRRDQALRPDRRSAGPICSRR